MTSIVTNPSKMIALVGLGVALAATGIYVAAADDPNLTGFGPAGVGMLLIAIGLVVGIRAARIDLPRWATRTVLAAGVLVAVSAAALIHVAAVTAALFPQAPDVPSAMDTAPPPRWAASVDLARPLVRAAIVEQNLPGVSIAVGTEEGIVWAEGFGWRDVVTQTPVTPQTRFNIGTAARAVAGAAAPLNLANTGADPAGEWSPGHIGEPEDDFPLFTLVHDIVLRPIGIAPPAEPLRGNRATFYVPRSDDDDPRRGRRLMYMRDLACCANGMAFYSTPSDVVRLALATSVESVDGELAGGRVMSLLARRDPRIVVAVMSNIAHAETAALAARVADVFAEPQ